MKKTATLILLLMAFMLPLAKAQTTQTAHIAYGNTTNQFIPLCGDYADEYQRTQFIYPASMLTALVGKEIKKIEFVAYRIYGNYGSTTENADYGSGWRLKLGICENSTFSSTTFDATTVTTQVYSGSLRANSSKVTITFSTPFFYTGGNLLVDLRNENGNGERKETQFYGTGPSNAAI